MSWSIRGIGTKEPLKKYVEKTFAPYLSNVKREPDKDGWDSATEYEGAQNALLALLAGHPDGPIYLLNGSGSVSTYIGADGKPTVFANASITIEAVQLVG